MKLSNKYNFASNINLSANIIGKGLEFIKNKLFNNKEEKGAINGETIVGCNLSGEMSLELSVEEMIELHKEYGEDFEKTIKYLKEEFRPCVKEFMLAIDDATAAIQKTIYDAEDRERLHDEKVEAERAAAEKSE